MTLKLTFAFAATLLAAPAMAQTTPQEIAEQLQQQGITDIVVYAGRNIIRATGDDNGTAVSLSFDRRTGEQVDTAAHDAEREAFRSFVDGLRESYDPDTDGSFREYVASQADAAGVDLPERGPRGGGRPGGAGADDAERPSRGGRGGGRGN